ncbi:hypoxanthine phosphoribosyltransferase [candidate division KSB3 bacterium]|uniref:Hypoxanthine phosphoribosyltransferase n=1 Tax=candidate division KSB3 bacterium TaxID=2044937 RepID=A0A2G6KJ63_9BACT|nr:MAG: hypoxanthine phosphoribosyltransferase [candidate division KSB3 bacterium]
MYEDKIEKILITKEMIQQRVKEMGEEISADYAGKDPIVVSILKGGVYFLIDLTRAMTLPHMIDFMVVSSYGDSQETSGIVRLVKDLKEDIRHRHVILIEDIIDTGLTVDYLLKNLKTRQPASVEVCSFLSKPSRRKVEVPVKYLGYEVPDQFVVGYGLDYQQRYRHLPFVCVFKSNE